MEVFDIYQSYTYHCLSIDNHDIVLIWVYHLLLYFNIQEWTKESIESLIEQVVNLFHKDNASGFYALLLIRVV